MNYILLGLFSAASSYFLVACATIFFKTKLPGIVDQSFRYGKLANKKVSSKLLINIPKKWFKHFYVVALISYIVTFSLVNYVYLLKHEVPSYVSGFIEHASGHQTSKVSTTQVYIAVCLMTLQVIRRFYDTHIVSIFGKNSYFTLHLYFLGLFFYPATSLAILCEAPKFVLANKSDDGINLGSVKYFEIIAIVVFFWAWWHQHTATVILANLRKNKQGVIVTEKYLLPHGDWFEYLTSPLQVAEILIYTTITIILRFNKTWFFVYLLVVINQLETIIQSHSWYQKTFKEMPKKRKAILPFIY